jgi:tRNA nucleotidyltransferase/poly(A) polymerase
MCIPTTVWARTTSLKTAEQIGRERMSLAQFFPPFCSQLTAVVTEVGGKVYWVGGCVRDALWRTVAKDFDAEVFGLSLDTLKDLLRAHFGEIDDGKRAFGVLRLQRYPRFDVALSRVERKTGPKYCDYEVRLDPSLTLEEAARRRDFGINAVYYDRSTDTVLDPVGGLCDVENRRLRHVSPAFTEDASRVLRGMQFVGRFRLSANPETIRLCRGMMPHFLTPKKMRDEFKKLVGVGSTPSLGFQFLEDVDWLKWFPGWKKLKNDDRAEWCQYLNRLDANALDSDDPYGAFLSLTKPLVDPSSDSRDRLSWILAADADGPAA